MPAITAMSIISLVTTLAPPIIQLVDHMFDDLEKPERSEVKKDFVQKSVADVINRAAKAGLPIKDLQKVAPNLPELLQAIYDMMDRSGEVNTHRNANQTKNPTEARQVVFRGVMEEIANG